MLSDLVRLARPAQWAKGAFVVIGPVYALGDGHTVSWLAVLGAVLAFGFASSGCYVLNDIRDRDADRLHPRKKHRPVASGAVSVAAARVYGQILLAVAFAALILVYRAQGRDATTWLAAAVGFYILNVGLYTLGIKQIVILDVISLAVGFVLRVVGGCAAAGVTPSSWLLNCTFFVSMFLAFGKRLGERRVMGGNAPAIRGVQIAYTDELLRMSVVVTAVASLLTYAGYVQAKEAAFKVGFNLLWVTVLPATYGLLRCIVLLERGDYDDPTELAGKDRPFQVAAALFVGITLMLMYVVPRLTSVASGG